MKNTNPPPITRPVEDRVARIKGLHAAIVKGERDNLRMAIVAGKELLALREERIQEGKHDWTAKLAETGVPRKTAYDYMDVAKAHGIGGVCVRHTHLLYSEALICAREARKTEKEKQKPQDAPAVPEPAPGPKAPAPLPIKPTPAPPAEKPPAEAPPAEEPVVEEDKPVEDDPSGGPGASGGGLSGGGQGQDDGASVDEQPRGPEVLDDQGQDEHQEPSKDGKKPRKGGKKPPPAVGRTADQQAGLLRRLAECREDGLVDQAYRAVIRARVEHPRDAGNPAGTAPAQLGEVRIRTIPVDPGALLPKDDADALVGQQLGREHWQVPVGKDDQDEPVTVVTVEGQPLLVHWRACLSHQLCKGASTALQSVAGAAEHGGKAAHIGWREAGYGYAGPHLLPAYKRLLHDYPRGTRVVLEVLERLATGLGACLPEQRAELDLWASLAHRWILPDTCFTGAQYNRTHILPCHAHPKNVGFVALAVLDSHRGAGGFLILPRLRVGVALATGDAVFFRASEFHGVALNARARRETLAAYFHEGLVLYPNGRD